MFTVEKGIPYPVGVRRDRYGINFSMITSCENAGVVLYNKDGKNIEKKIPFKKEHEIGNVKCFYLHGLTEEVVYAFYEEDTIIQDERGKAFAGRFPYGDRKSLEDSVLPAIAKQDDYDWEGDVSPAIRYEDSIGYCLHVRGFTKHASSKVKGKGTFLGVIEKIPYLKELGITTVEFQPVNEFREVEYIRNYEGLQKEAIVDLTNEPARLQYWGYVKGCYYSPKSSYSYSKDAGREFRDMVKAFHRNGMEVILQFYFTKEILPVEMIQILVFWVLQYHVDGFHLKGENIDISMITSDPALAKTKIWYYSFEEDKIQKLDQRYLAEYREDFRMDMRKFLKGDEDMVSKAMYHLKKNPVLVGNYNYLSNYDGFTMMDMVSFDRKHNEANGEENRDGTNYNVSWNCGYEGLTKKKTILALRLRQIKNAFLLLMTAQSSPLFFMGDEFGNSQKGNNNPYCQDNEVTWLNWKNADTNRELYEFVKNLISLRKKHGIFHQEKEVRMMDYGAVGMPDASYHGEYPWKVDTSVYSRQFGIMYCGTYAKKDNHEMDDFFYVAYNMHWDSHSFGLPKLPGNCKWEVVLSSAAKEETIEIEEAIGIRLPARTICILTARIDEEGIGKHEDRTAF